MFGKEKAFATAPLSRPADFEQRRLRLLCASFMLGSLAGSLLGSFDLPDGAAGLIFSLSDEFASFDGQGVFLSCFALHFIIVFFSFTVYGPPVIPLLFALRGCLYSCASAQLVSVHGLRGLFASVLCLGVPDFFYLPALFYLGLAGMSVSSSLLRRDGPPRRRESELALIAASFLPLVPAALLSKYFTPYLASVILRL